MLGQHKQSRLCVQGQHPGKHEQVSSALLLGDSMQNEEQDPIWRTALLFLLESGLPWKVCSEASCQIPAARKSILKDHTKFSTTSRHFSHGATHMSW